MIKSIKHKGLKRFFETGATSGIQAMHASKLRLLLTSWRDKPRRSGRGSIAPVFSGFDNSTIQYCSMQRLQAFKYELMPTGEQQRQMRCFAGSCRFVFNKALALQKERHERGD